MSSFPGNSNYTKNISDALLLPQICTFNKETILYTIRFLSQIPCAYTYSVQHMEVYSCIHEILFIKTFFSNEALKACIT